MKTTPIQWKLWCLTNGIPGIIASVALYAVPAFATDVFAWAVPVRMSALFLAASFLYRIGFFVGILRGMSWRRLRYMLGGNFVFSLLLLVTTFLHPDKFRFDIGTGWIWLFLYLEEPIWMVLMVRAAEKQLLEPLAVSNPPLGILQFVLAVEAMVLGGAAGMLYFTPAALAPVWPWELAPVTARVVAGFAASFCVWAVALALREDWEEMKFGMQMNLLWLAALLVTFVAFIGEANLNRAGTIPYVGFLTVALVALAICYVLQENSRRRQGATGSG